jgi:two-component system sensor histidine kinase MprB
VSLRLRIALASALAVIIAFGIGGVVTYQAAKRSLYGQVDRELRAAALREAPQALRGVQLPPRADDDDDHSFGGSTEGRFGAPGIFAELINDRGEIVRLPRGETPLPPSDDAAEIAARGGTEYDTIEVDGDYVRTFTAGVRPGLALQVGRSVNDIRRALSELLTILLIAGAGGVLLAIVLGIVVADRGLVPFRRLTRNVEEAARTRDLTHRIPEEGGSESVAVAGAVNRLLGGLEEARAAQDQLVADAAHELRTPLTALRTDVETLGDAALTDEDRRQIAQALDREIDEVSRMITGIVDLARGARPVERAEPLHLDEVAADVVARARSRHPAAAIELDTAPAPMTGDPLRLERALGNLVENALLHGAAPVTVRVRPGEVIVDDAGPGIPAELRTAMFERFRRGADVQNRPGSGLGLAIVRQDIAAHGGTVEIADAPGGGCRVLVRLPGA